MKRRLLVIDNQRQGHLETLRTRHLKQDPREDYAWLSGEALCQYLLRRWPDALIIARGPLAFLSGNKATVGYISPITHFPHYSLVGGRAAAQLLNLGLDAICFHGGNAAPEERQPILVVEGRAPDITVRVEAPDDLPRGQRAAYYWLLEHVLGGAQEIGSIFTLGEGAALGYASSNIAVEGIYHAGRGGAGLIMARYAAGLVLEGVAMSPRKFWGIRDTCFIRNPHASIAPLLDTHCARLSARTGGTITKLWTTGAARDGQNTLPSHNAQRLGYVLADLGSPAILKATREGQTGCQWCQVDCRHWHSVPAEYAPSGQDRLLDDFEPTYAIYAMLGLIPEQDSLSERLAMIRRVEQEIILPIEQMGCDVINVGTGLAALLEGVAKGIIPGEDVPEWLNFPEGGHLGLVAQAVNLLRREECARYPALRLVGDGPQALAERYSDMADIVFTGGPDTMGNAGHANALWTFMMPFSRFFGHYVGQLYKIEGELPPEGSSEGAFRGFFRNIVRQALHREFYWILGNCLSQCAFVFVIYSQDGLGEQLSEDGLLVRILNEYGIRTNSSELEWFSQSFWAQSTALKCDQGWRPPKAEQMPMRVFEALSLALGRSPNELQREMNWLIDEWKQEAAATMRRFGYQAPW